MDVPLAIRTAAQNFVRAELRDRFVHEASRRPDRLMARICHAIDTVFEDRFRQGVGVLPASAPCVLFELTGRCRVTTWGEATEVARRGGGGVLVVGDAGRAFLAQAEGFPPPAQYAGNA